MIDYNIIASVIIALLGGGALVRIIELFINRAKLMSEISQDERENLRRDIVELREEINDLREQVHYLREKLNEKIIDLSRSSKKVFALKLIIEKIIMYLKSAEIAQSDEKLMKLIDDALKLIEGD
jgi:polyhydroxyalkanoate synthesis regulator phasin